MVVAYQDIAAMVLADASSDTLDEGTRISQRLRITLLNTKMHNIRLLRSSLVGIRKRELHHTL
jgi:hypothetical protein